MPFSLPQIGLWYCIILKLKFLQGMANAKIEHKKRKNCPRQSLTRAVPDSGRGCARVRQKPYQTLAIPVSNLGRRPFSLHLSSSQVYKIRHKRRFVIDYVEALGRALSYIEASDCAFDLRATATAAGIPAFLFSQMFLAVVGESASAYAAGRRRPTAGDEKTPLEHKELEALVARLTEGVQAPEPQIVEREESRFVGLDCNCAESADRAMDSARLRGLNQLAEKASRLSSRATDARRRATTRRCFGPPVGAPHCGKLFAGFAGDELAQSLSDEIADPFESRSRARMGD
jgi:hypothetical protein